MIKQSLLSLCLASFLLTACSNKDSKSFFLSLHVLGEQPNFVLVYNFSSGGWEAIDPNNFTEGRFEFRLPDNIDQYGFAYGCDSDITGRQIINAYYATYEEIQNFEIYCPSGVNITTDIPIQHDFDNDVEVAFGVDFGTNWQPAIGNPFNLQYTRDTHEDEYADIVIKSNDFDPPRFQIKYQYDLGLNSGIQYQSSADDIGDPVQFDFNNLGNNPDFVAAGLLMNTVDAKVNLYSINNTGNLSGSYYKLSETDNVMYTSFAVKSFVDLNNRFNEAFGFSIERDPINAFFENLANYLPEPVVSSDDEYELKVAWENTPEHGLGAAYGAFLTSTLFQNANTDLTISTTYNSNMPLGLLRGFSEAAGLNETTMPTPNNISAAAQFYSKMEDSDRALNYVHGGENATDEEDMLTFYRVNLRF